MLTQPAARTDYRPQRAENPQFLNLTETTRSRKSPRIFVWHSESVVHWLRRGVSKSACIQLITVERFK